jgi:hypothetical protein
LSSTKIKSPSSAISFGSKTHKKGKITQKYRSLQKAQSLNANSLPTKRHSIFRFLISKTFTTNELSFATNQILFSDMDSLAAIPILTIKSKALYLEANKISKISKTIESRRIRFIKYCLLECADIYQAVLFFEFEKKCSFGSLFFVNA